MRKKPVDVRRELREMFAEIQANTDLADRPTIGAHLRERRAEIDAFLKDLRRHGDHDLADHYEDLRRRYRDVRLAPINDERTPLASFHLAHAPTPSFTLPGDQRWSRLVGYAAVLLILGMVGYMAYRLYRDLPDLFVHYAARFEEEAPAP